MHKTMPGAPGAGSSLLSSNGCGRTVAQHATIFSMQAGVTAREPEKKCLGIPDSGGKGLAGLGEMGDLGIAIESDFCRHWQGASEEAQICK
jgi:hypothetical protein